MKNADDILKATDKVTKRMSFFAGIVFLIVLPALIARQVFFWTFLSLPTAIHIAALVVFFGLLGIWAWFISGERCYRLFETSYAQGIKWPILFSISLLWFSLPCFAALTATLHRFGHATFEPAFPADDIAVGTLQDFYLWHFLDSIPGLDIPKTLVWERPFTHMDRLSGFVLLGFKIAVIIPVIASFAVWNDIRKKMRKPKNESAA
jgi:hypothetical protein